VVDKTKAAKTLRFKEMALSQGPIPEMEKNSVQAFSEQTETSMGRFLDNMTNDSEDDPNYKLNVEGNL